MNPVQIMICVNDHRNGMYAWVDGKTKGENQ